MSAGGCDAGSAEDVIELPTDSNIVLSEALPDIISNITINANGSSINRDPNAANFSVLQVGSLPYIANLPTLVLNDATITGGYRDNNYGGGISTFNSSLILNNSTISNNTGGGITLSSNNNSEINNSIINNNQSTTNGNYYGGALSINSGNLTVSRTTISNNTSNSGLGGAGIYASNYGGALSLTIENSTISGNSSTLDGAGVFHYDFQGLNDSDINITHSTIVNNQSDENGGGVHNDAADFTISQSLISGNTASINSNEVNSIGGTFTLNDYNLIDLNNDNGSTGITVGATDMVPTASNLSEILDTALANNGGLTPTHSLVAGSPAIDAITLLSCASTIDQIGNGRGIDGNDDMQDGCDIGAIEYQPVDSDLIFQDGFETPPN